MSLSATRMSGGRPSRSTTGGASGFATPPPVTERTASPSANALSCRYFKYSRCSSTVSGWVRSSRRTLENPISESRRVFPELVDLAKHSLAVEAPLDLVRLQSVAVMGDHLELLAQAGEFRCTADQLGLQSGRLPLGGFDGLASPVTVCRGRVTIRGGLVALLPCRVEFPLELRQALALRGDGLLMAGELGAERLRHRFEAREELPPVGNGVAQRAGQVRRVRHDPITV